MRHAFVPGGSGQVGEGIVRSLLSAGHRVTVPTRSPDTVRDLFGDEVDVVEGSLGSHAAAQRVLDLIEGAPTDLVASIGGWWSGPPFGRLPDGEWERVRGMGLDAHVHTANVFGPALASDRPTYTLVNGAGALRAVPGSGLVSVSAAAQLMLGEVLANDWADTSIEVTSLVVMTPVITRDRSDGPGTWLTADQIGDAVTAIVAGAPTDTVEHLRSAADVQALRSRVPGD